MVCHVDLLRKIFDHSNIGHVGLLDPLSLHVAKQLGLFRLTGYLVIWLTGKLVGSCVFLQITS